VVDLDSLGYNFAGGPGEFEVLCFDFRNDLKSYFATRTGVPVAGGTLQTAIDFDNAHTAQEMPFFNQDIFDLCNSMAPGADDPQPTFGGPTYNQALAADQQFTQANVDGSLTAQHLDAIASITDNPAWATDLIYGDKFIFGTSSIAAGGGYPIIQVPATSVEGAPMGISFFGTAFSEPKLIKLASGFEAFTQARSKNLPTFASTLPFNNIQGAPLTKPHHGSPLAPANPDRKIPHNI